MKKFVMLSIAFKKFIKSNNKVYLFKKFMKCYYSSGFLEAKNFIKVKINPPTENIVNKNILNQMYEKRFKYLKKIATYTIFGNFQIRFNLITDSINESSLFGGVITSIIFAVLISKKYNANLRIITRTERAEPYRIKQIFEIYGFCLDQNVTFEFCNDKELDIHNQDFFITTSWWNTYSILPSVRKDKIIYMLQEDETMFYPFGDEHLLCRETLANKDIQFVVNTKLLYDHLINQGLDNLKYKGQYFEPAFNKKNFYWQEKNRLEKKKFFFYARAGGQVRNLFYRGILVLERVIDLGILNLEQWDIYFVGSNLEDNLVFNNGYSPKVVTGLGFGEYCSFIREVDLGLSLMYTPHPSYPPLDLAACGAVVVTNMFGNKTSLENYSSNIISSKLDIISLSSAIEKGIKLAQDIEYRKNNYYKNNMLSNWEESFENIFKNLVI